MQEQCEHISPLLLERITDQLVSISYTILHSMESLITMGTGGISILKEEVIMIAMSIILDNTQNTVKIKEAEIRVVEAQWLPY